MSIEQVDVVDFIKNVKLGEVKDLVQRLEDELGVKASAPVIGVGPAVDKVDTEPEQTEFDVKLMGFDAASKLSVIRAVRGVVGLGLREVRDLINSAPVVIREGLGKEAAEELATTLREAGAEIELV